MQKRSEALGMRVSGNIISELSDRIPSNFMALNELVKNAYDADASSINIEIDSKQKIIIVQDTGIGMDRKGIQNLFHIARSNKDYAAKRENGRITQGEKGLGALATFHFGNIITWETSQDGKVGHRFTVRKDEIIDTDDISEYETVIEELRTGFKGTKITISEVQNDDFNFLLETLNNKKTTAKLVRSLYDSSNIEKLKVSICIDGNSIIDDNDLMINEMNNQEKIYSVRYKSEENSVYFYYKDLTVLKVPFILDKSLYEFEIECNLNIYDFGGKIKNPHFPALYHKEQEKDDIIPLVYINQGFFKNYTLFDVDRLRRIGSDKVLAQITGEIEIRTQSSRLMFNADRTEINENPITAKLKTEIERLNIFIQETGAKYKHPFIALNREDNPFIDPRKRDRYVLRENTLDITDLDSKDIENLVKSNITNDIFLNVTTYVISSNKVTYRFFDKEINIPLIKREKHDSTNKNRNTKTNRKDKEKKLRSKTFKPAIIKLKHSRVKRVIGFKGQVNLYDYIISEETLNSLGNQIALENITISDDKGFMKPPNSNILPNATEPQIINITYSYHDENTGPTSETLEVIYSNPQNKAIKGKYGEKDLIHDHGIGNLEITFDVVASNLVNQINNLIYDEYIEMVACSLRTLFELGIDAIRNKNTNSDTLKSLQSDIASGRLDKNVKLIVEFIRNDKNREKITKYLAKSCTNVNFNTIKNIANPDRISTHSAESNLGAHKGTKNLTKDHIINIANDVGAYLIFVEAILGAFSDQ